MKMEESGVILEYLNSKISPSLQATYVFADTIEPPEFMKQVAFAKVLIRTFIIELSVHSVGDPTFQ